MQPMADMWHAPATVGTLRANRRCHQRGGREQAAALVLGAFIRTVRGELELLMLECVKTEP